MRNRIVLNSPRILELKKKRQKVLRKKMIFYAFIVLLVFTGLAFLSRWQKMNIDVNNIQIEGNKVIDSEMIDGVVKDNVEGNYIWVFPKTNVFLFPKDKIARELAFKYKRLKNISINIQNLNTLNISLDERTGKYTFCGATVDLQIDLPVKNMATKQKCYFIDSDGYIFDEAPYFSGDVYLKFYGTTAMNGDLTAQGGDPLGSYFYEPIFNKLILFKESTEKFGIKPVAFSVEDSGDIKMFLSSSTSDLGPEIIFKSDANFEKVSENLQSVLTTEPLQSDFKNKYSSLLYIDLRFGNKVYYKFK